MSLPPEIYKGYIYCLKHKKFDDLPCYVGSTRNPKPFRRMKNHLSTYKYWKRTGKNYCTSFKCIEDYGKDLDLQVVAEITGSKSDIYKLESLYIHNSPNCVNKNYINKNSRSSEYHSEYQKHYYRNKKKKYVDLLEKYNKLKDELRIIKTSINKITL